MKKHVSAGFTLIELLMVITIIGILAAVVLSSLNDARGQAIITKIKTEMDAIGKTAAIQESKSFTYDTVCGSNGLTQSSEIAELIASINTLASSTVICNSDTTAFALSVPLGTAYWCVDSVGVRREIQSELVVTPVPELVCP